MSKAPWKIIIVFYCIILFYYFILLFYCYYFDFICVLLLFGRPGPPVIGRGRSAKLHIVSCHSDWWGCADFERAFKIRNNFFFINFEGFSWFCGFFVLLSVSNNNNNNVIILFYYFILFGIYYCWLQLELIALYFFLLCLSFF